MLKTGFVSSKKNDSAPLAWFLLFSFLTQIFAPTFSLASGGGPTQPEVHGFTPIGVSDMVDPFTGDFSYNLPIMDIDGYPLNISYNAGITMDQEASWVGLGWSLHTGSLNRAMRGVPDDFAGDEIITTTHTKPQWDFGYHKSVSGEIFGLDPEKFIGSLVEDWDFTLGFSWSYSNYSGIGFGFNTGVSLSEEASSSGFMPSLNANMTSENGMSFTPKVSYDSKAKDNQTKNDRLSISVSSPFNSRAGLQAISFGMSFTKDYKDLKKNKHGEKLINNGFGQGGSFDLGLQYYTPSASRSTKSFSLSGKMSGSATLWGIDGQGNVGFNVSIMKAKDDHLVNPSFGFLNLHAANSNDALLDFNRDNDAPFTRFSSYLPSAFYTYDIFSVNAQGTGGSFRPIRNDFGSVYDPSTSSYTVPGDYGIELGAGNLGDIGGDVSLGFNNSKTGKWIKHNQTANLLSYNAFIKNPNVPPYSMVASSEASVDPSNYIRDLFNGDEPVHFKLEQGGLPKNADLTTQLSHGPVLTLGMNMRPERIRTNQQLYFLPISEYRDGFGVTSAPDFLNDAADHHIGEVTQLGTDGRRYVFGLPAYNTIQKDVTFAVGNGLYDQNLFDFDEEFMHTGLYDVSNFSTLNSEYNDRGIDNYFNSKEIPAYAHSWMLTSILSDDYVDSDNEKGPSLDDLGTYVKFSYTTVKNHKWRTPMEENKVYYNQGLKSDETDDKASYVYGVKDLHYIETIETKNYVAVFFTSPREDGSSASGEAGGVDPNESLRQHKLDKIMLFTRPQYEQYMDELNSQTPVLNPVQPIQTVEFVYDYSLCDNYPANVSGGGKLTLKEIIYYYEGSNKMKYRSYTFEYSALNPSYDLKAQDKWGNYKPNVHPDFYDINQYAHANNGDVPYVTSDKQLADTYASAWNLRAINLPSGGRIEIEYESDDYGFVQHLPVHEMIPIIGCGINQEFYNISNIKTTNDQNTSDTNDDYEYSVLGDGAEDNRYVYFRFKNNDHKISDYVKINQMIGYKALISVKGTANNPQAFEYITNYAKVKELHTFFVDGIKYGSILFYPVTLKDSGQEKYHPFTKDAIAFGRSQLSRTIYDIATPNDPTTNSGVSALVGVVSDLANSMATAVSSPLELVTGPNLYLYGLGVGRALVPDLSFLRLQEPDGCRLGGGHRVKEIKIFDNWDEMTTSNNISGYYYGQRFSYKLPNGSSSGVASYEPLLGGEENIHKNADIINEKKLLRPDIELVTTVPVLESQFPSPSVGYSRVEIADLKYSNGAPAPTGKVVKEFYTAKEFPTLVDRSEIQKRYSNSALAIITKAQHFKGSQGFSIVLNDMHGKPKKEAVYAQGEFDSPISSVEYVYQAENSSEYNPHLLKTFNFQVLNNQIQIVNPDGSLQNATIGERYDLINDVRHSSSKNRNVTMAIGTNSFLVGLIPGFVPSVWPSFQYSENSVSTSTLTKTVNKFGVLEKTIAQQDGSFVTTKNLAYDSRTGEPLVTETATNFDDAIYTMNYPAYWHYPSFGLASNNILFKIKVANGINNGTASIPPQNNLFTEGDEVSVYSVSDPSNYLKAWVVEKNAQGIKLMDKAGNYFDMTGSVEIKVIRSGFKNKQSTSMASMTTQMDPRQGLQSNNYSKVLNAGAVEFTDVWNTYCDCFTNEFESKNPYVNGTRGNLRPIRSYTHLTERTQTDVNGNTNIRQDGFFTSYSPFYSNQNGTWAITPFNWTFVSEVTEFSPNGMTLETRDALGRFSSTLFSFNNTLATSVAANTSLKEQAFGSFEDLEYTNCTDQNFFNRVLINSTFSEIPQANISTEQAHTGRTSLKVGPSSSVTFKNVVSDCPEDECNIVLTQNNNNIITVSGGTPVYQFTFDTNNNADATQIAFNKIEVEFSGEDGMVIIYVVDAEGCTNSIQVTNAQ